MKSRVLCVYDEGAMVETHLIGAKGFSLLVETDEQRILFSTGRRGNYLMHNMGHLGIDPESIDSIVLSHGHKDHTGALNDFLTARETPVPVYAHNDLWATRAGTVAGLKIKDVGAPLINDENKEKADIRETGEWTKLTEHLYIMALPPSNANPRYRKKVDGEWTDDLMEDEVALVLMGRKGPVMICGCCHCGLIRAMAAVKERTGKEVHTVIGGIHTEKMKNPALDDIALQLKEMRTPNLYLNHCTSRQGVTRLRMTLGLNEVKDFYAGYELQFEV